MCKQHLKRDWMTILSFSVSQIRPLKDAWRSKSNCGNFNISMAHSNQQCVPCFNSFIVIVINCLSNNFLTCVLNITCGNAKKTPGRKSNRKLSAMTFKSVGEPDSFLIFEKIKTTSKVYVQLSPYSHLDFIYVQSSKR